MSKHDTHKLTIELSRHLLPGSPKLTSPTTPHTLTLEWATGGGAAWRARYLYLNGAKVAHLGVDPNNGVTPQAFGSLLGRDFRFRLPTIRWKHPTSPLRSLAYQVVSRFWHNVDGRYGWGSKNGGLPLWPSKKEGVR